MTYFIMGIAVVVSWVLFRRLIITGVLLATCCAFYFYLTNDAPNLMNHITSFTNTNKIEQVKSLVDQEAQTVLSFYSTLSDKGGGGLTDQLTHLSNMGGGKPKILKHFNLQAVILA